MHDLFYAILQYLTEYLIRTIYTFLEILKGWSGAKIYYLFLVTITDANLNEYEKEVIDETLAERQSSDIGDPKEYLDAKILESMGKLPGLIAAAKQEIEDKLRFTLFKKNTQGWSIVAAGVKDIFGDWVGKDYKLQTQSQLYTYGFYFFYGLGFGLPALVGNPSLPPIDCGLENYQTTLDRYGLSYGPVNLVSQVLTIRLIERNMKFNLLFYVNNCVGI